MTNKHQAILERITAWVEKQSSVGPAAFKAQLAEIEQEVEREQRRQYWERLTAEEPLSAEQPGEPNVLEPQSLEQARES